MPKAPKASVPVQESPGGLGGPSERPWKSKIVGHDSVDPATLIAHSLNFRVKINAARLIDAAHAIMARLSYGAPRIRVSCKGDLALMPCAIPGIPNGELKIGVGIGLASFEWSHIRPSAYHVSQVICDLQVHDYRQIARIMLRKRTIRERYA